MNKRLMVNRTWAVLGTMAFMLSQLGDNCGGNYVEDSQFQLWKSETELAAWEVEQGSIRRAPTWHKDDPGVEFVATPTVMSQQITASNISCVQVTLMGLVEPNAELEIVADGSRFSVPALDWSTYTDYVGLKDKRRYDDEDAGLFRVDPGTRLQIAKRGPGKVILTLMEARSASGCRPGTYQSSAPVTAAE